MLDVTKPDFVKLRRELVENYIAARGVRSELVLAAMRKVPREAFIPKSLHEFAAQDSPLPIAEGQTISQPYFAGKQVHAVLFDNIPGGLYMNKEGKAAAAVLGEI